MSNPVSKFFLAAIFIYILTISAVWADRILVDDPEQTVTVSDNFSCYQPVDITVDTVDPGLYEAGSAHLQKLGDSVRAMLSYECPGLSSIQLTGLIRGLDDVVYQGEMLRNNNWLVKPLQTADQEYGSNQTSSALSDQTSLNQTRSGQTGSRQKSIAKRYDDELKQGLLEVTGLHLGMSVEQVTDLVIKTFEVEPQYDAQTGLMTMSSGLCPADLSSDHNATEINSELKCLQAWFSDNRVAQLQRLHLFQVVDGQVHQVNGLLVNKYGSPTQTNTADDNSESQMVWRAINADNDQTVIQEIDAVITALDSDRVATDVTLYNTHVANDTEERYVDLDLKL